MKLHQQTFIIQYSLEGRADQATKPPEEEEKRKKNLIVCLRPKWFICNTISKIYMVIP